MILPLARAAPVLRAPDNPFASVFSTRIHVRHCGGEPLVKRAVVIDNHNGFSAGEALCADRLDRLADLIPSVFGVDANDYGVIVDTHRAPIGA